MPYALCPVVPPLSEKGYMYLLLYANPFSLLSSSAPSAPSAVHKKKPFHKENSIAIAILAGVVNFLPHPNPPRTRGEGVRDSQMMRGLLYIFLTSG